jgi:hypothetical protein
LAFEFTPLTSKPQGPIWGAAADCPADPVDVHSAASAVAKAPNMNNLVFTSIPNGSDIAVNGAVYTTSLDMAA